MNTQSSQTTNKQTVEKQALNKRLESIGWALFLIMIGGLGLVPRETIPGGTGLIRAEIILKPLFERKQG